MSGFGEKIKELALELTKIPSVVGSSGEVEIAHAIYRWLNRIEYFKQNPDRLMLMEVKDDPLHRKYVLAIIEAERVVSESILLLGHIDTVGIEDYADLKEWATDPVILKRKLREKKFSDDIMRDVLSDNWIFGRGIFDMKTGVAALMVMLEEFSRRRQELEANLIFIAVPDEEGNSTGMLSAVQDLAGMCRDKRWEFIAAIDTDYMTGQYDEDQRKYIYIGTVGKLLPCFYVVGKETHAGEAFHGLDANLLASELMKEIDLNYELCDIADGEVALPPVSLYQRDLKKEYSVQTVNAVSLYFNFATHISTPDQVLIKLKEKAVRAFDNVIEKLNMEYRKYCELSNIPYKRLPWKTKVLTFQELYNEVKTEMGEKIDEITKQLATKLLEDDMDDREFSLKIVREVHKYYSDKDPIIVIYFAPPYYPHIYVRGNDEMEQKLLAAVNRAVEETKRAFDYDIKIKKFYPYISDLSYCSITGEQSILSSLIGNMPAWPQKYSLPLKAIQKISMPVVNIGPYGKDAHKLTERLSVSYSLDAMPAILEKTIENLACSR